MLRWAGCLPRAVPRIGDLSGDTGATSSPGTKKGLFVGQDSHASHPSGDNRFKLLDRTINAHHGSGHALIEVMHAAQNIFGFLEDDLLVYIARALKRPLSQVYGVATFYNFFRLKPAGKHTFVLCTGTACYVKGADGIQKAIERRCGVRFGETTPDGQVSLIAARCVGSCGLAPVAVVDDEVAAKLTAERALERLESWAAAATQEVEA